MKIIKEGSDIWKAIDKGGSQTCDVIGVVRELDKAGYYIVSKNFLKELEYIDWDMKAELDK